MDETNKPADVAIYEKKRFWIFIVIILVVIFLLLWLDRTYFGLVLDKTPEIAAVSVEVAG